ncbi:hypothetical protein EW145_g735 [Phellinidium pouzarii]|uniref:Uncharacterized protein n=1 Tax=Phellinidium pouzarii TaxID=167371 RepID=A0A4V3XDW0_9AGAM|nr:hypothetical protein EW145_g735 [Phellinidium pouzarii]
MNLPKTAFCSFTYNRTFFSRYSITQYTQRNAAVSSRTNGRETQDMQSPMLKCQLQTKTLLSILKHRNTDKSAEKCELTIIDGVGTPDEEIRDDEDTLESRLIVRLHCKHGIVKTHRLLLNNPSNDDAPRIQNGDNESRIVVQAHAVKEIIEHFPNSRCLKSDPELIWRFDDDEVKIKSLEKGIDAKGKSQLATELTLGADEFDVYDIILFPLTVGFFLREFNAAITLADALLVPIDMRFTRSAEPVYINAETDDCAMLFVIATNHVRGDDADQQPQARADDNQSRTHGSRRTASGLPVMQKRTLEDDSDAPDTRRPRIVHRNGEVSEHTRPQQIHLRAPTAGPEAEADAETAMDGDADAGYDSMPMQVEPESERPSTQSQPLFLASQLSAADVDAIRASGLGIEDMDADQFAAMLDEEGEEVNFMGPPPAVLAENSDSLNEVGNLQKDELEYDELDDEVGMGPTQIDGALGAESKKARPDFSYSFLSCLIFHEYRLSKHCSKTDYLLVLAVL